MSVLAAGIPLSLLVDLADEAGPDSARILRREVADTSWLDGLRRADEGPAASTAATAV